MVVLLIVIQFVNRWIYYLYPKIWEPVVADIWAGLAVLYAIVKLLEWIFGKLVIAVTRNSLKRLSNRQKEILFLFMDHNHSKKVPLNPRSETVRNFMADEIIYAESDFIFRPIDTITESHTYFKITFWVYEYVIKYPELLVDANA